LFPKEKDFMTTVVETSTPQNSLKRQELVAYPVQSPAPPFGLDIHMAYFTLFGEIASSLRQLTEALCPSSTDKVGSDYVSNKLGCTSVYVAEMARNKKIPSRCIVPGTGNGKPWKFFSQGNRQLDCVTVSRKPSIRVGFVPSTALKC
jgi:hypothetical protein